MLPYVYQTTHTFNFSFFQVSGSSCILLRLGVLLLFLLRVTFVLRVMFGGLADVVGVIITTLHGFRRDLIQLRERCLSNAEKTDSPSESGILLIALCPTSNGLLNVRGLRQYEVFTGLQRCRWVRSSHNSITESPRLSLVVIATGLGDRGVDISARGRHCNAVPGCREECFSVPICPMVVFAVRPCLIESSIIPAFIRLGRLLYYVVVRVHGQHVGAIVQDRTESRHCDVHLSTVQVV